MTCTLYLIMPKLLALLIKWWFVLVDAFQAASTQYIVGCSCSLIDRTLKAIGEATTRNGCVGRPINPTSLITNITSRRWSLPPPTPLPPLSPPRLVTMQVAQCPKGRLGTTIQQLLLPLSCRFYNLSPDPCKVLHCGFIGWPWNAIS